VSDALGAFEKGKQNRHAKRDEGDAHRNGDEQMHDLLHQSKQQERPCRQRPLLGGTCHRHRSIPFITAQIIPGNGRDIVVEVVALHVPVHRDNRRAAFARPG